VKYMERGGFQGQPLMRLTLGLSILLLALFWVTNFALFASRLCFTPASVVAYYIGSEADYRPARTAGSMLEVTHAHLPMMALVVLLLTHLLIFAPYSKRTRVMLIVGAFLSAALDEGAIGWVATHRRPLDIPDVLAPDAVAAARVQAPEWWQAHGLRSFYGVPIILEGSVLAVLVLNGHEPLRIDPAAEEQIAAFTAQAALAMKNAAAYEAEARARREAELALAQVNELQGLLPICAWCKKVRNDRNYWESIETYIAERSRATFSHGICPDCRQKVVMPEIERWKRERGPAG